MKHINKITILIVLLLLVILPTRQVLGQSSMGEIGFFEELVVKPGVSFEVPVEVRDTNDLFAVDIEISFDPQVLQAQDADSNSEGIQLGLGEFLDPGLLLYNDVDNQTGVIRFAMSQVNPSEPKAGDGILLVIYFEAVEEGESGLEINKLEASNNRGDAVTVEPVEGRVVVENSAADRQVTAIPVVNPTSVIIVPTSLPPTAVPTVMPTATTLSPTGAQVIPTATQEPTATALVITQTEVSETTVEKSRNGEKPVGTEITAPKSKLEENTEDEQFKLFNSWWFAGLMFLVLIVLAYFFFKQSRNNPGGIKK